MVKGRYVPKRFTIKQMADIRSGLETATQEAFDRFDKQKRRSYTELNRVLD